MAKHVKKQIDPIKKAHLVESFTQEQISELQKCSTDFMYFVTKYCYIQHPTKGKILFEPYDFQVKMLEAFLHHNNLIYMCGRQLGKSTCASLYIIWRAMFFEDQTILIASNKRDSAIEIMDRIKYTYEFLPHFLKPGVIVNNRGNVVFDNQSEIITRSTTKDTGRGLSISLLYCLSGNTTVRVRDKETLEEKRVSLSSLYEDLYDEFESPLVFNLKYDILTPDGWKDFRGVQYKGQKITYRISLKDGAFVDATGDHYFFNEEGKIQLNQLLIGNRIDTINGLTEISSIDELGLEDVYDIVEVDQEEHKFIVNHSIISKNCDELGAVDPIVKQKDFWSAIRPTLSTGGQCIITSTPLSDEDTFAQIWNSANDIFDEYGNESPNGIGKNGFKGIKLSWEVHPDRDEAWADTEKAAIGIDRFLREHEVSFISDSDTLINPIKLASLRGVDPKYLTGQTRWYQKPSPGKTYLVGLDPSLGTGNDPAAIQVFQVPEMIQIAEWQHNRTDPRGQAKALMDILKYIDNCVREHEYDEPEIYWSLENNAGGGGDSVNTVIFQTGEEKFPGTYISEPNKTRTSGVKNRKGFTTTNRTKLLACSKLKSLIERDKMVINSKPLVSELKMFVSKGASYGAKAQEHDDLVSAALLITRMLEVVMKYSDEFEQELSESLDEDYEQPLGMIVSNYNNPYNYQ